MRFALLGDVHANLPALQAVVAHAQDQDVAGYWNIGDFVGYGPFPNEVIDLLRDIKAHSIIGNYDQKVLKFPQKAKKWRKKKHPLKYLAFRWTYETLSKDNREYLASLPNDLELTVARRSILLTHASPQSNEEHLTPETPQERLQELAHGVSADLVVFGHSHRPFVRRVDGVWLINTGSVGRPDDGDPRSCYAILELSDRDIQVQHYRLTYDVDRTVKAIRGAQLPEPFAQMMVQGYNLDEVLERFPQQDL